MSYVGIVLLVNWKALAKNLLRAIEDGWIAGYKKMGSDLFVQPNRGLRYEEIADLIDPTGTLLERRK